MSTLTIPPANATLDLRATLQLAVKAESSACGRKATLTRSKKKAGGEQKLAEAVAAYQAVKNMRIELQQRINSFNAVAGNGAGIIVPPPANITATPAVASGNSGVAAPPTPDIALDITLAIGEDLSIEGAGAIVPSPANITATPAVASGNSGVAAPPTPDNMLDTTLAVGEGMGVVGPLIPNHVLVATLDGGNGMGNAVPPTPNNTPYGTPPPSMLSSGPTPFDFAFNTPSAARCTEDLDMPHLLEIPPSPTPSIGTESMNSSPPAPCGAPAVVPPSIPHLYLPYPIITGTTPSLTTGSSTARPGPPAAGSTPDVVMDAPPPKPNSSPASLTNPPSSLLPDQTSAPPPAPLPSKSKSATKKRKAADTPAAKAGTSKKAKGDVVDDDDDSGLPDPPLPADARDIRFKGTTEEVLNLRRLYNSYHRREHIIRRSYKPDEMADDEKDEYEAVGRLGIRIFAAVENPLDQVPLPRSFRRAVRKYPDLVPSAATTSYQCSLHCLMSAHNTTRCVYHWRKPRRANEKPSAPEIQFNVHGNYNRNAPNTSGVLDCGCSQKAAVWEFFTWKVWEGNQAGHTEGMPLIGLRAREFVSQNMVPSTGLYLTEFFNASGGDWWSLKHQLAIRQRQLRAVRKLISNLEQNIKEEGDEGN